MAKYGKKAQAKVKKVMQERKSTWPPWAAFMIRAGRPLPIGKSRLPDGE